MHKNLLNKLSKLTLSSICFLSIHSANAEECNPSLVSKRVLTEQASAGFFANLRGSDDSIRMKSDQIMKTTFAKLPSMNPAKECSASCIRDEKPKIIFRAAPNVLLTDYDEYNKCAAHLQKTSQAPLTWNSVPFDNYDDFADRFSDFSRGKGKYGEELYEKCDGNCSPQYKILITSLPDGKYLADVNVICGHARDKDDGMFTLITELQWQCKTL